MAYITAGLDVGSTYTKAVVLRGEKIAGRAIVFTEYELERCAKLALERALAAAELELSRVELIAATGYGRNAIGLVDHQLDEVHAKAVAIKWLGSPWGVVRTLIDVGGQDSKVLKFDKHCELESFVLNTKCAAGTGRFLEVMAQALGVDISEMGTLSLKSQNRIEISSTCIVMAESEVISLIARKRKREDIIAAVHRSVAERVGNMAKKLGVKEVVVFEGGPARNIGLKRALEEKLNVKLYVPPDPQISAALGR
jgi:predicted CoA-substrate-specific enzyme activase